MKSVALVLAPTLGDWLGNEIFERGFITQWERLKDTMPSTRNLTEVATVCQVRFEWLATGRGVMRIGDTH